MSIPNRKEIREFASWEVTNQISHLKEILYLNDAWNVKTSINFHEYQIMSKGGVRKAADYTWFPFIELSLWKYTLPVYGFTEYDAYKAVPDIGSFSSSDWQTCISALISHELAHAIHIWDCLRINHFVGPEEIHGETFQSYYRLLRNEFANKKINFTNEPEIARLAVI